MARHITHNRPEAAAGQNLLGFSFHRTGLYGKTRSPFRIRRVISRSFPLYPIRTHTTAMWPCRHDTRNLCTDNTRCIHPSSAHVAQHSKTAETAGQPQQTVPAINLLNGLAVRWKAGRPPPLRQRVRQSRCKNIFLLPGIATEPFFTNRTIRFFFVILK